MPRQIGFSKWPIPKEGIQSHCIQILSYVYHSVWALSYFLTVLQVELIKGDNERGVVQRHIARSARRRAGVAVRQAVHVDADEPRGRPRYGRAS